MLLDDEVAAAAADARIQLFGYSSLLGGAYSREDRPIPDIYQHAGTAEALTVLREVADSVALDPGQVVLAWMTQRRTSVVPVVGVSRPDQLASALDAVSCQLPDDAISALDDARNVS